LLAMPRWSPQWELAAVRALMKPQTRGAIEHSQPLQAWPATAEAVIRPLCTALSERLVLAIEPHFPPDGDYRLAIQLPGNRWLEGKAAAKTLSLHLPGVWLTLGRVFVRDGIFFNRERGYKLTLRESSHHRVTREMAAAVRDLWV